MSSLDFKIIHVSYAEPDEEEKAHHDRQRRMLADLAMKGAKLGNLGKMCSTCAFKLDSDANLEPHNVDAAADCIAYGGTFNCHVTSGVDKGCECVGFKYAKAYFESL